MKYNWAEMSPRERDALVAEKVMGLKPEDAHGLVEFSQYNTITSKYEYHKSVLSYKPYTTDISAAWEVVEKLKHFNFIGPTPDNKWNVVVGCESDGNWNGTIGETASEAICLAALRAKGVDI